MVGVTSTSAHAPTVPIPRPPAPTATVTLILPMVTAVLGFVWGALSIGARHADASSVVAVTDTWWSWATVLALSAALSRRFGANLLSVLACGIASGSTYYVLKAQWAVGYPSHRHDAWQYLQTGSWERWTMAVLVLAVPAAVAGTAVHRLLRAGGDDRRGSGEPEGL